MAIAFFPSLEEADIVEVVFVKPQGAEVTLRLLVDSGFTGQSSFVLDETAHSFAHAAAPASQVAGALQGNKKRMVVSCGIAALSFRATMIAILADPSSLALPRSVKGIAGLRFLRHFKRWGAERVHSGAWQFYLELDAPV